MRAHTYTHTYTQDSCHNLNMATQQSEAILMELKKTQQRRRKQLLRGWRGPRVGVRRSKGWGDGKEEREKEKNPPGVLRAPR